MKNRNILKITISVLIFTTGISISNSGYAIDCIGKVTRVLSGTAYCDAGQRVGFIWTGGHNWLCSSNKNMDALIITAYTTGKSILVTDGSWLSCDVTAGTVPNHIWFIE